MTLRHHGVNDSDVIMWERDLASLLVPINISILPRDHCSYCGSFRGLADHNITDVPSPCRCSSLVCTT